MAARGGSRKVDIGALLQPLITQELATIGAIDAATPRESQPGYVMLLHAAKQSKQANVEQLVSIFRFTGAQPVESGGPMEAVAKLQSTVARRIGTTPMLRAMRLAEAAIVAAYGEVFARTNGMIQRGIDKCRHRAIQRMTVLTAHIAIRSKRPEVEERIALAMPLEQYFAHGEDRVCFRCLFDRPGRRRPLERTDPHPYTYLCAACHQEVRGDFPPDLGQPEDTRVIEKALGRPSKLVAESLVLPKMSGLAPDMPPPPLPYKDAQDASPKRRAPAQPRPRVELGGLADSRLEQQYTDALFDFDTVRANW